MIDYELLNTLIGVGCAVGIVLFISILLLTVIIGCYFLMKCSKLDNDNFIKRVRSVINERERK